VSVTAPALSIENLSVGFASGASIAPVVRGVSLAVPRGKTMALVGESGSGKTTIAQSIMGLLPHTARITGGRIVVRDAAKGTEVDVAALDPRSRTMRDLRGGHVGMIFQEPSAALSPVYTVGNLLMESARTHLALTKAEAHERAVEMLARAGFDRPILAMDRYPFELSGGLRQRAMIAAALICNPSLLIADEPTSALDVTVQALLLKQIADLQAEMGMSVLLITHDLGVVATVADEMTVLYRGEVMEQGSARELLKDPAHPYLKALMAAGPSLEGHAVARLTPLRPIPPLSATLREHWTRRHGAEPGKPILRIDGVSKSFTARSAQTGVAVAVRDVSLDLAQGECLGLVGESGCGKSTLCKIVMGALQADSGQVELAVDGTLRPVAEIPEGGLRQRMQYVFQDPFGSLNPRRTIKQAILEPFEIHRIGDAAQREAWAAELMDIVGLRREMLGRFPNAFSGGQRQRVAIARALALKPDLLVCDEPVSALDVSVQAQIVNLLSDLKASLGMAILFVSHNLGVVRHLADRVAVMCAGRIVELAPKDSIFGDPRHPYTRALIAAAPDADPDRKHDLTILLNGRASDPEAWDAPFRLLAGVKPRYETVSDGHIVAVA
jgi:peptide/nickel transport system ATP-binding protein